MLHSRFERFLPSESRNEVQVHGRVAEVYKPALLSVCFLEEMQAGDLAVESIGRAIEARSAKTQPEGERENLQMRYRPRGKAIQLNARIDKKFEPKIKEILAVENITKAGLMVDGFGRALEDRSAVYVKSLQKIAHTSMGRQALAVFQQIEGFKASDTYRHLHPYPTQTFRGRI